MKETQKVNTGMNDFVRLGLGREHASSCCLSIETLSVVYQFVDITSCLFCRKFCIFCTPLAFDPC